VGVPFSDWGRQCIPSTFLLVPAFRLPRCSGCGPRNGSRDRARRYRPGNHLCSVACAALVAATADDFALGTIFEVLVGMRFHTALPRY
jgi:hypothetical protein